MSGTRAGGGIATLSEGVMSAGSDRLPGGGNDSVSKASRRRASRNSSGGSDAAPPSAAGIGSLIIGGGSVEASGALTSIEDGSSPIGDDPSLITIGWRMGPGSVIGASSNPYSIGHIVIRNLSTYGYKGPIFPINPKGGHIRSFKAFRSVLDVPDEIDLVNISVAAKLIPDVIRECGEKGIKFAIVHSAGFKEDPAYDYKGGHPTGPGMPSGEYSEKPMKGGGGTAPLDPAVPFTLKP